MSTDYVTRYQLAGVVQVIDQRMAEVCPGDGPSLGGGCPGDGPAHGHLRARPEPRLARTGDWPGAHSRADDLRPFSNRPVSVSGVGGVARSTRLPAPCLAARAARTCGTTGLRSRGRARRDWRSWPR